MRNCPIHQIAGALGVICEEKLQVTGYQIDSRRVGEGELFFALRGAKVDGHSFLGEVKKRGGIGAVVDRGYEGPDFGLILFRVGDVGESLRGLARHFASQSKAQVIAVTGSVGKTTTKEFIGTLLSGKFRVGKTEGSYNTKLTLPITILNRTGLEDVWVLEMGMTEPGDIRRLLEIVVPDVAILTKIALAHVAAFAGGLAEIAREKAAIFTHPKTKKGIFYHGLNEYPEAVALMGQEKVSFSLEDRSADYFLSFSEGKYLIDERGVRAYQFHLPFHQPHVLHNFLGAVSVARQMKLEWDEINQQIGQLQLPKMRFEQFEKEGVTFINDAYNANPDSMRAALTNLPEPKEGGKRIAVLATMVELGSYSENSHREVGRLAHTFSDHLLAIGPEALAYCEMFDEVKKPAEHFSDHESLTQRLKELMCPGDVVLVKGSRRMQLEKIFEILGR
ncbi:MAG TPA: UDP-N-acetylmuramoyl-tripeptide--D-alanyl-D-alanine ligase [Chlamydiales bacterium]|nr:UDP-N-acetylmuramoyl-tripeptide--D-alanyl-D-alanine ligase [Chlamydiales bacterium]